jgi:sigma-B regulation protein RsbU (phosphoserine phosphatase)
MSDAQELQAAPRFRHGIVVLLVDDQAIIGEAVRRMLASEQDITLHYCQDAREALQQAEQVQPTVILQDLVMPHVDGLDLVPQYRQQASTQDTPLIVLSTKEEATTKAEAFARGANDYLVKLPDPLELIARIRYHSKGYIALLERNEAFQALAKSEQALRDELSRAAEYVTSLLPEKTDAPVTTDWRFIPSAALGGDAFDYQWVDPDHFAICLLDVCGHGVGSALLSVSVINALRSRALAETDFTDPAQVLSAVNRAFPMERQNFLFFTMWYGVYDRRDGTLRYGGGGHPSGLLMSNTASGAARLVELESTGPMVGLDDTAEFPSRTHQLQTGDQLFVYSDGVFEVRQQATGEMWTFPQFLEFMRSTDDDTTSRMDQLLAHVRRLQGSDEFVDDFSIVEMAFER